MPRTKKDFDRAKQLRNFIQKKSKAPKVQHADPQTFPNQVPKSLKVPRREDVIRILEKMEQEGRLDRTRYKSKADLILAVDEMFHDNSGTTIQARLRKFLGYYMKSATKHCEICDMNDHFSGGCPNKGKDPKDFTPFKLKCSICLQEGAHWTLRCPYLIDLPHGATVGPGAYVVGKWSGLPIAPDAEGEKRAVRKYCLNCSGLHWREECPHQSRLLKLTEAREKARTKTQGKKIMNFLEWGRTKEDVLRDVDILLKTASGAEKEEKKLQDLLDEVDEDDHLHENLDMLLHQDLGPEKEEYVRSFFENVIDMHIKYAGCDSDAIGRGSHAIGSYHSGEGGDIRMESVGRDYYAELEG